MLPCLYALSEKAGVRFIRLPYKTRLFANWRKDDTNPVLKNVLELVRRQVPKFTW